MDHLTTKKTIASPNLEGCQPYCCQNLSIGSWNIELLKTQGDMVWAAQSTGSQQLTNNYRQLSSIFRNQWQRLRMEAVCKEERILVLRS